LSYLYKKTSSELAKKIRKAKAEAWDALLRTLDDDPWGIPYKLVMDRLRNTGPTVFESLEPAAVEGLLGDLFPNGDVHDPGEVWRNEMVLDLENRVTCDL